MISSWSSIVNANVGVVFPILLLVGMYGLHDPTFLITYGYGLSISAYGVVLISLTAPLLKTSFTLNIALVLIQSCLLALYGLRLNVFMFRRKYNPTYKEKMEIHVRLPVAVCMWIMTQMLYFCYGLPVFIGYRSLLSPYRFNPITHGIGVVVMILGLGCEAQADREKTLMKAIHPSRHCDAGLYRYCRMPNYFGEMTFWTGCFVSFLGDSFSLFQLLFAGYGFVCMCAVMLGAARRLDRKQYERYHADPDYMKYRSTVPVLFPFFPLYSMISNKKNE